MYKLTTKVLVAIMISGIILLACKKSDGPNTGDDKPATIPEISMNDMSQPRSAANSTMQFYANLSSATTNSISFDYSIVDGTATAPKDFVASTGTITIPAGKTQAIIDVQLNGDPTNLRQSNIQFTLKLSNPKNCTLKTQAATGTIITEDGTYLPTDNTGYSTPLTYSGYTLLWSDEFSATTLNLNDWNQEIGNGSGGWGNNELEYYTSNLKNCFLSDGKLIIEARKENAAGFSYTSSRLTTQNKKSFKFGRIDIRAKLPVAKGMWPALWMLGNTISSAGWPACGETDIMELIGTYPSRITGTAHWRNASGAHASKGADYSLSSGNFSQQFHVFSLIWKTDQMQWLIDDHVYFTLNVSDAGAPNYPFNAEQFFIFNVAVGGNWPGSPDSSTTFPQRMFVDYVRVFQQN
jgi:Beta-glucanase/Beta-glucan synthetase